MPTVMLVDDEELSRFALRTLLSRNFADMTVVAEAETGEEAVEKYARYRPDGVLMDIRIPGINGLEASRRILAEYPKASILICSAYDSFSLVSEALDIGVKGYLLKPVKREEAVAKISKLFHARVSATEAFADQQVLALLTANALGGETRAQITRYYGRLDDGVLMAASCPGASEEQLGRLGYLLKKRAPSLGYVFTGALEGLFAALVSPADDLSAWENRLGDALNEAGFALASRHAAQVEGGAWAGAWSTLARALMAAGTDDKGLNLLGNIDRLIRDDQLATLSLESLAAELGVSPQHLSASFKERVGVNFIEYITRRRMRLARRLLTETGTTSVEVARRCGYADPTYFRKLFAKYYGVSPQEYRSR